MKDKRSIEEQVAELTEKQKDTILKVDIIGGLVIVLGALPGILLMIINTLVMLDMSLPIAMTQQMTNASFIIMLGNFAFVIGVFIFIKVKFPYYSAKKCDYIRKSRKANKR